MDLRPAEILRRVVILDSLGIPYMLGGSYASSVHEIARYTRDAGLVVDLRLDQVEGLAAGLGPEFYVSPVGILLVQRGRLDVAYLDRWATDLGVRELLDRAVKEAATN